MNITIYRANQIGGQITKITTSKTCIIIDLGHNLPGIGNDEPLDDRNAVGKIVNRCDAVLYTHYHGDHLGLFHHVPDSIPQYIGRVAKQVVEVKYEQLTKIHDKEKADSYQSALDVVKKMRTFNAGDRLQIGDISITPYFVSHSAYESFMFLIEAEGKRILHTGDFRGHGYLSKGLSKLLPLLGRLDVLTIEGTMLGRKEEQSMAGRVMTERELQQKAKEFFHKHKFTFVQCSSTDLDRLAAFKQATREESFRRAIIVDSFQKKVLEIFSKEAGAKSKLFDFGYVFSLSQSSLRSLKPIEYLRENGFTMFIRPNISFQKIVASLLKTLPPEQTGFIYSQWSGYLDEGKNQNAAYVEMKKLFEDNNIEVRRLHTSGHADMATLKMVCIECNPSTAILSIHHEPETDLSSILPPGLSEKVKTIDFVSNNISVQFK